MGVEDECDDVCRMKTLTCDPFIVGTSHDVAFVLEKGNVALIECIDFLESFHGEDFPCSLSPNDLNFTEITASNRVNGLKVVLLHPRGLHRLELRSICKKPLLNLSNVSVSTGGLTFALKVLAWFIRCSTVTFKG